eukprot:TRINITY_DN699_c0_g1_i1.p1 TRINITY_DN699_c0_g1~~TRINITY_DN699_c0_g1_i1.p1  ORF type:complete len:655 (-),score=171.66 TRINITY_DN699_c0_g1_i1:252-2216(-)
MEKRDTVVDQLPVDQHELRTTDVVVRELCLAAAGAAGGGCVKDLIKELLSTDFDFLVHVIQIAMVHAVVNKQPVDELCEALNELVIIEDEALFCVPISFKLIGSTINESHCYLHETMVMSQLQTDDEDFSGSGSSVIEMKNITLNSLCELFSIQLKPLKKRNKKSPQEEEMKVVSSEVLQRARRRGAAPIKFPDNVGILAMEMYFPRTYVHQQDLEKFMKESSGKFTKGLGQDGLAFVSDREDIYSLCLTAVSRLMKTFQIGYDEIGRLEVATETVMDHSKSIKSVLMQLFQDSGNTDIEGVDTIHACYGGTNALFNAVNWVESSSWDGRYALVVCGDIAEYAAGPARPTGGAGAVAMLVGPGAPVVLERGTRASHMEHVYDFYKPHMDSPYPVVDGQYSADCYLNALDICYDRFKAKSGGNVSLESFDHCVFHSPFNKLVQKSFARLHFKDYLEVSLLADATDAKKYTPEEYAKSKEIQQMFMDESKQGYVTKVVPSTVIPKNVGNMYSASLYASLLSLISEEGGNLAGKRILMFSYGSGLASSMFAINVLPNAAEYMQKMADRLNIRGRLNDRVKCTPEVFTEMMNFRHELHMNKTGFVPIGDVGSMFPGTYFLTEKNAKCQRSYECFDDGTYLASPGTSPQDKMPRACFLL